MAAVTIVKGHPYWEALYRWAEEHKHGRITIVFQDGIPVNIIVPTEDRLGTETVKVGVLVEYYKGKIGA